MCTLKKAHEFAHFRQICYVVYLYALHTGKHFFKNRAGVRPGGLCSGGLQPNLASPMVFPCGYQHTDDTEFIHNLYHHKSTLNINLTFLSLIFTMALYINMANFPKAVEGCWGRGLLDDVKWKN